MPKQDPNNVNNSVKPEYPPIITGAFDPNDYLANESQNSVIANSPPFVPESFETTINPPDVEQPIYTIKGGGNSKGATTKQVGIIDTDTGKPLSLANVYLKDNPKVGSTPNSSGIVSIAAPSPDSIVVFSHVGYVPKERVFKTLGSQINLDVLVNQEPPITVNGKPKSKYSPWLIGAGVLGVFGIAAAASKGKKGKTGLNGPKKSKRKGKKKRKATKTKVKV